MTIDPSFRQELDALDILDAHEHIRSLDQCLPRESVTDFIKSVYLHMLLPFADTDLAARIEDRNLDDRTRWKLFINIWPAVRCTGMGRHVLQFAKNWGLGDDLSEGLYEPILQRLQARSPQTARQLYAQARIVGTVTHGLAHPCYGGIRNVRDWLEGRWPFGERVYPILGVLPMHEFFSSGDVHALEETAGESISSLADMEKAVLGLIDRCIAQGVVGLKDHAAYTRGLSFGRPDRASAEAEFGRLMAGERFEGGALALSDYMFARILRAAEDYGKPMAIHTGHLADRTDAKANVRLFAPVIQRHPGVRFDLFHMNMPWVDDMLAVLKQFPNTWTNGAWAYLVDPFGAADFLRRALGSVPANHVFAFGGDQTDMPESVVAHLATAKDTIASVLGQAIADGWCSRSAALHVAKTWLHDAPREFYRV